MMRVPLNSADFVQLRPVALDDGVAAGSAIGGQQAVGGGEGLVQTGPVADLGVIGQGLVGLGYGGGWLVGAVRAVRPEQRMVAAAAPRRRRRPGRYDGAEVSSASTHSGFTLRPKLVTN